MKNNQPIAIVTGANRGLGKEVSRQLARQNYRVVLTARSLEKAKAAVNELSNPNIVPAQLDVNNVESIQRFRDHIIAEFGSADVLVNNAAIHYDTWQRADNADIKVVREAMDTNLYGAWYLTQYILPLLLQSPHPRIVNVSSGSGAMKGMSGGNPAYSVSKAALNALTLMLAENLKTQGVLVNAVCPGWVATDMGGQGGRPVEDGAKGIVWAATLKDGGPTGGFFRDGKAIDW